MNNGTGPIALEWPALAGAAALLLVNAAVSVWLKLGLERKLLVATARTVVQLTLLGLLLVPVFAFENAWVVLALCLVMVGVAGIEAVRRLNSGYRGIGFTAVLAMFVGVSTTALFGTAVVIRAQPWWTPQYLIPLTGMILGNILTGVSLGLDRCLEDFSGGKESVELWLARGASRWEAARPVVVRALRTGMLPILNTMSVVGLVTIPGMMTGQILGGTPPGMAARYQMLIMFLIAAATALGTLVSVLLSTRALFDGGHRLRAERILRRKD